MIENGNQEALGLAGSSSCSDDEIPPASHRLSEGAFLMLMKGAIKGKYV